MHDRLGLKRFIFDGRGFSRDTIEAVNHIKRNFDDVEVGVITDGVSAEPFLESLLHLPLDWVDISVDGLENDHDRQRGCKGAFRKTIRILHDLKDSGHFEKVNILTCLTTINVGTVLGMVEFFNDRGFKNFFMTPVSFFEGYRPTPGLRMQEEEFVRFLDQVFKISEHLLDTWIEVDIYEAIYANWLNLRYGFFNESAMRNDHFEYMEEHGTNEIHVSYYPSSLTGIRELIINSDGNCIPPMVVAMGNIPKKLVFANVFDPGIMGQGLPQLLSGPAFSFYVSELVKEKRLIQLMARR